MSLGNTVVVLNQWRRSRVLEPISYGCLQRFVSSSEVMVLEKRETIKAGSKDEGAAWAWARGRCMERGRKTKLRKHDRKSTHLLELPLHPALIEAYKGLLGPEGGGTAAEGP